MLIHITPRIIQPKNHCFPCTLVELSVPELELSLTSNELATRKPYPNKNYSVGCRRAGLKTIDGILVDTPTRNIDHYTVTAKWSLSEEADIILTHVVRHIILDNDFDAVSDNMLLWQGAETWESRWPDFAAGWSPASAQPRMDILSRPEAPKRDGEVEDETIPVLIGEEGLSAMLIRHRFETFRLPTIERERLLNARPDERLPTLELAFCI